MKLSNSSSNLRSSRLQTVAWFNKKEWEVAYQQTYTEDTQLQAKAYTQMCIWKARYPNLPLGVECTMSMLHVRLCDKQTDNIAYKDADLQLLYSTAVMRFLNHLTVMSRNKDSMYKMAAEHKIPDWLINLRHEAAHGNSVPALYLLRQAGDIILQWLREHYWEVEADAMADVVKDHTHCRERESECANITELLELWFVLKMNYWAGCKTIDNITDKDVSKKAMELAAEEGLGIRRQKLIETKKGSKKRKVVDKSSVDIDTVGEERPEEFTHKIKTAFEPLVRRLLEPLKGKPFRRARYRENLIECMIKYKGFCPPIHIEQLNESEALEVMSLQGDLWKEVLEGLQSHRLLPSLLAALASADEPFAQLWLLLLTQLLSGEPTPHPPGTEVVCQLLAENLPCDIDSKVLLRKANLHHVKHLRPLVLKPASAKEVEILQKLAHTALDNPTRCTSMYLASLLSFWETPMSRDTREKLCALARIYTDPQPRQKPSSKVYTLASLLDLGVVIDQSENIVKESTLDDDNPWKLYSGDADWSRCALGVLPW